MSIKTYLFLLFLITISITSGAQSLDTLGSSGNSETYICIPIRRGDRMTLTGSLSFIDSSVSGTPGDLMLTTAEGRLFLLKGELELQILQILETGRKGDVSVRGIILFEGWKDRLPQLDVQEFTL